MNSQVTIGFELEFETDLTRYKTGTSFNRSSLFLANLSKKRKTKFVLDNSINGWELVSAPMDEQNAFMFLREAFNWIKKENDIVTTDSCGLHVNIGFKDKKIDFKKLSQTFDTKPYLKMWGREKNSFCKPLENIKYLINKNIIEEEFNNLMSSEFKRSSAKENDIFFNEFIEKFNNVFLNMWLDGMKESEKSSAMALKNDKKTGQWVEFRMFGNVGYEEKYLLVKKQTKEIIKVLEKCVY